MPKIQYNFSVEMQDGTTYDAVADQRDVARFEIQPFGTSAADMATKLFTSMRFLAWSALDRKGSLPEGMSWDKFERECVEVLDTPGADDAPKAGKEAR